MTRYVASGSDGHDANDYSRFFSGENGVGDGNGADRINDEQANALRQMSACSHDKSSERAIFDLPLEEKMRRMRKLHERGNIYFDEGQYARAVGQYKSANVIYDYTFPDDDATWKILDSLRSICNLNSAACNLKIAQYDDALQNCREVLREDSSNVKALYRRARVHRHRDEYDQAKADLTAALKLMPHNYELREEYALLRAQIDAYGAQTKAMASRMMQQSHRGAASGDPPEGRRETTAGAVKKPKDLLLQPPRVRTRLQETQESVVDDLYEAVSFDFSMGDWSEDLQEDEEPLTEGSGLAFSSSFLPSSSNQEVSVPLIGRERFVFGDLNRPGAFVPRRRKLDTSSPSDPHGGGCLCCP